MILCLATLLLALTAACLAHADSRPAFYSSDFSHWPLADWAAVREASLARPGAFVSCERGIANFLPAGADEKDIIAAKDGLGLAAAVARGAVVRDCTVVARLGFERKGAPSILLRTQLSGEVTGDTLSLVLYEKGVNLWRFGGGKWSKAGAAEFPVAEKTMHRMEVRLVGPRAEVRVDGESVLKVDDVGLAKPGAVGIWAGEGPCVFQSLRMRCTDTGVSQEPGVEVLKLTP